MMICFYLPSAIAQALALPGGEPATELHLTLAVFEDEAVAVEVMQRFLLGWSLTHGPLQGVIGGVGRFNNDDPEAFYASFDSPELPAFRQALVEALEASGFEPGQDHGYIPHITLAYLEKGDPDPLEQVERLAVEFTTLSLKAEAGRFDYVLAGQSTSRSQEERMPQYLRAYRLEGQAPGQPGDPITFVASTSGVKRDGQDLDMNRWRLENYRANPVFLWVHDYWGMHLPLGRCEPYVKGGRLMCDTYFDQKDEFARRVEQKYRDGYLHAVSVGWDAGEEGYDLLDISAVPVPGDPQAVMERQRVALRSLQRDLEAVLDPSPAQDEAGEAEEQPPEPQPETEPSSPPEPEARTDDPDPFFGLPGFISTQALVRFLSQTTVTDLTPTPPPTLPEGGDTATAWIEGFRAGAVLSKRNKELLGKAMEYIQAVIEAAGKEEEPETESNRGTEPDGQRAEDPTLVELQQLFNSFNLEVSQ